MIDTSKRVENLKIMLDEKIIADEFPQAEGLVYLNHAAIAPWPRRTKEAVIEFAHENVIYGASRYYLFTEKERLLREQIRRLINAPSTEDIALVKNTSEAISIVASGLTWKPGDNVVTSKEEFPSNRIPWDAQKKYGVSLREVNIRCASPEQALMDACDDDTRVLAISSVQFSSGVRVSLELLGAFCGANNILFCIDAIQSIGAHSIDVQSIQADFIMADAHKWMLGPEGIALLYVNEAIRDTLTLYQYGWHMTTAPDDYDSKEWSPSKSATRFEPGSSNMLGVYALSASLSLIEEAGMVNIEAELNDNITYLFDKLAQIDGVTLITPSNPEQRAGIVSFQIADKAHQSLHKMLRDNQVICACRGGALRFSPHYYSKKENIDRAIDVLTSLI